VTRASSPASAKIVHIDIDASEHNKNKSGPAADVSEIKYALTRLNELLAAHKFAPPDTSACSPRSRRGTGHPFRYEESKHIVPRRPWKTLYDSPRAGHYHDWRGQHQMWAAQFYRFDDPAVTSARSARCDGLRLSCGHGAEGPPCPDKQVIDIRR